MKKIIPFAMLMALCLSACSSDDQQVPTIINNPIKQSEIVGVWTDGDYFMSFNPDGYYASFLPNDYLSCGTYTLPVEIKEGELHFHQEDSIIEVRGHFGYSIIHISEINSATMKVNVVPNQYISSILHKTDRTPATHNYSLVGQTYNGIKFIDEYTAIMTADSSDLNYILYDNKLYLKGQNISVWDLSFDASGNVISHKVIV